MTTAPDNITKPERTCEIEGCGGTHYGRGYCHPHYDRWRLHGDPLGGRWPRTGPPPTPTQIAAEMREALAALTEAVNR